MAQSGEAVWSCTVRRPARPGPAGSGPGSGLVRRVADGQTTARALRSLDAELARRGRRIAYRYLALRQWLHRLPASTPGERADRLIDYHHQMVWQALCLALRPESPATSGVVDRIRGGLGSPARQMRDLADAIKQEQR